MPGRWQWNLIQFASKQISLFFQTGLCPHLHLPLLWFLLSVLPSSSVLSLNRIKPTPHLPSGHNHMSMLLIITLHLQYITTWPCSQTTSVYSQANRHTQFETFALRGTRQRLVHDKSMPYVSTFWELMSFVSKPVCSLYSMKYGSLCCLSTTGSL